MEFINTLKGGKETTMSNFKNRTGERFGCWSVIELDRTGNNKTYWKCICDCGKVSVIRSDKLTSGRTRSCGCNAGSHGMSKTKFYRIWKGMRARCISPKNKDYHLYGGRGIRVSDDWLNNFSAFYKDMHKNYLEHIKVHGTNNTSIDRIDFNGDYSKENCRWTTNKIQQSNKRNNKYIHYNGEKFTISELARKHGLHPRVLFNRLYNEWDLERALKTPVRKKASLPHNKR